MYHACESAALDVMNAFEKRIRWVSFDREATQRWWKGDSLASDRERKQPYQAKLIQTKRVQNPLAPI